MSRKRKLRKTSPIQASARQRELEAIAQRVSLESGKINRLTKLWKAAGSTGDASSVAELQTTRHRAWDLFWNNPYARKLVRAFIAHILGCGLKPESQAVGRDGEPDAEFRRRAKECFGFWSRDSKFYRKSVLALQELVLSGEVLVRKRFLDPFDDRFFVPYDVELVSCERLVEDSYAGGASGTTIPVDHVMYRGIEFDAMGRRVAYHLHRLNPQDQRFLDDFQKVDRVPADEIIHLYWQDRPDQQRGISWFATILKQIRDIGDYTEDEMQAALAGACVTMSINRASTGGRVGLNTPDTEDDTDDDGNTLSRMQPGMIIELGKDESISGFNPQRPNVNAVEFLSLLLRGLAMGLPGIKTSTITGDYRESSFSSEKSADNDNWREIEVVQEWIAESLHQPVWSDVVWMSVQLQKFDLDRRSFRASEVSARKREYLHATWQGPVAKSVNPAQDIKASTDAIAAGLSSIPVETAAMGLNWEELQDDEAKVAQRRKEKGLPDMNQLEAQAQQANIEKTKADAAKPAAKPAAAQRDEFWYVGPNGEDLSLGQRADFEFDVGFRALSSVPVTLHESERAVDAVVATENPVLIPDYEREEMLPEVLLMSGAQIPQSGIVPLLNSHSRKNAEDVIGSAVPRIEGDKMLARTSFSSTAEGIYTRVKEGHLRDLSVGYRRLETQFVPPGKKATIAGREFVGPVHVTSKWQVREVSVTPIGADAQTKFRSHADLQKGKIHMDPKLREQLVGRGMPADLDDAAAIRWAVENPIKETVKVAADPSVLDAAIERAVNKVTEQFEARQASERKLHDYIRAECKTYKIDKVQEVIDECRDELSATKKILKLASERQAAPYISFGADSADKFDECMRTTLCMRALEGTTAAVRDEVFPVAERHKGWESTRNLGIFRIAEKCLQRDGVNTDLMNREQIARAAFGDMTAIGNGVRSVAAYHHTSSFPQLTLDAFNVSLRAGYKEYPSTWQIVFPVGEPFQDFKAHNMVQFGEFPNVEVWPGIVAPNEISVADAKETFKPEAYSNSISYGWKLLINDSMGCLGRTSMQFGQAAARTLNTHVWSQITANGLMQDGIALFSAASGARKKDNLSTGAGAPSVSTLQTGTNMMMQQVGLNNPEGNASQAILGLRPKFIVGPSALSTTIKQLVLSAYDPANANMTYNTATELVPVIEPLLDASSTTAWYLFCSPAQFDTMIVSFLQGYETPQVRQKRDEDNLALKFTVLQAFAAKPLDWRGMYKHAGA